MIKNDSLVWSLILRWIVSYERHEYVKKLDYSLVVPTWTLYQNDFTVFELDGSEIESAQNLVKARLTNNDYTNHRLQDSKSLASLILKNSRLSKEGNLYENRIPIVRIYSTDIIYMKGNSIIRNQLGELKVINSYGCDTLIELKKLNWLYKDGITNGLIHIISDINILIRAYELIKSNPGNITPGSNKQTLDGISIAWLEKTSILLKTGKFKFKSTRRTIISKIGQTELRLLEVTNLRDKVVQKAILIVLECIYEPIFVKNSHGFRPNLGIHSALQIVDQTLKNAVWVIEGDILKCSDSIDHNLLLYILRNKISCEKTLHLIKSLLKSGYKLENEWYSQIDKGTPQGSVLSPILANIYLHSFDMFIINQMNEKNIETKRRENLIYMKILNERKKALKDGDILKYRLLRLKLRSIPSRNFIDNKFVRISYVRYADNFVIGIIGPHQLAVNMKKMIRDFLNDNLKLTLNLEKTKITHFTKDPIHFLGAEIINKAALNEKPVTLTKGNNSKRIRITPRLSFKIPILIILEKLKNKGFLKWNDNGTLLKGTALTRILNSDHSDIIRYYNQVMQGLLNYYSFADNRSSLRSVFHLLRESCALTLALKHKIRTQARVFKEFGSNLRCPETGIKLFSVLTLERVRVFNVYNNLHSLDRIFNVSWANKMTRSVLNNTCIICDNSKR